MSRIDATLHLHQVLAVRQAIDRQLQQCAPQPVAKAQACSLHARAQGLGQCTHQLLQLGSISGYQTHSIVGFAVVISRELAKRPIDPACKQGSRN